MANKAQPVTLIFKDKEFIEQFTALVLEKGKIKIVGLGIFEIRRIKERAGYNIRDGGGVVKLKAYNKLAFTACKKIKDTIQNYGHQSH